MQASTVKASTVRVRAATEADLSALNDLYNHYVAQTHYTFDVEPMSIEARHEWFAHYDHHGRHRVVVAGQGDALFGYASSSRYRLKAAYDTSVEVSIYVTPSATGSGVGTMLYAALFDALGGEDLHRAYAAIALPNTASIALHEKFRFQKAGHYHEQGRKFGRYWDVAWYEKALGQ